ncbi:ABC transporter substrate-binding protein [Roseomonas sp. BN140053]|uniref:ABC transporter substrate-binding protein n=1 Tax=Roseomonas sp. BN140053 TaxID=3391898 RepID=UPI0039EB8E62
MTLPPLSRRGLLGAGLAATALPFAAGAQTRPPIIGVGADPAYTPFFLAGREKMFEADGINLTMQSFADGGEALNALVAQQVDLSCGAEPTTMIRLARAELRPLAIYEQSGRYLKLVARREITAPGMIRKFGIVAGTVSEYSTGLTIRKFGIDPASVQFVRSGPPELPALLARGDVDAYFAWEPWPTMGVRQGGHVLLTSGDVGYTYTMWLTAAAPWLERNADLARNMLKTLARSCDIVRADPNRAAAAVQAMARIPTAQTMSFLGDVECQVRDFTPADLESYDMIADFLAEQKITPTRVDYRRSLQLGFFKA